MKEKMLSKKLSTLQQQQAKAKLRDIKISPVCQKIGVPYSTILNVLNGRSPRIDLLEYLIRHVESAEKEQATYIDNLIS